MYYYAISSKVTGGKHLIYHPAASVDFRSITVRRLSRAAVPKTYTSHEKMSVANHGIQSRENSFTFKPITVSE